MRYVHTHARGGTRVGWRRPHPIPRGGFLTADPLVARVDRSYARPRSHHHHHHHHHRRCRHHRCYRQATKFFSITSFFSGFKNNLIGMVGFVTTRRLVKKNFDERMEYEVSWGLVRYDTIR